MRNFIDKHLTSIIVILIFGILMQGISITRNFNFTDNLDREMSSRVYELENEVAELERRLGLLTK